MMIGFQSDDKIHRTLSRLNKQLDSELLWLERLAAQNAQIQVIQDQKSSADEGQVLQISE
jgi:hypothetical protein